MKEDHEKPLHADYTYQKALRLLWSDPVISRGKSYELDMPLVVIGRILIVLAIGVIGWLNPYSRSYPFETAIICFILFFIATAFYKYKFAYRFGRFHVTWEDETRHPDEEASSRCDKNGEFLKTEENRIFERKSRPRIFGVIRGNNRGCFALLLSLDRALSPSRLQLAHGRDRGSKADSAKV